MSQSVTFGKKPVSLTIDLGDGESLPIVYDRRAFTPKFERELTELRHREHVTVGDIYVANCRGVLVSWQPNGKMVDVKPEDLENAPLEVLRAIIEGIGNHMNPPDEKDPNAEPSAST